MENSSPLALSSQTLRKVVENDSEFKTKACYQSHKYVTLASY